MARDAAIPSSGCSGPVLICSAQWWNCALSASGTPTSPQMTCTGYLLVMSRTRSARPCGAISSSRRMIVGRISESSQRSSADARNACATRLR